MKRTDNPRYIQHSCPEDLGNITVLYDPERDDWVIYNAGRDQIMVTNIVWCPFCGNILNRHDEGSLFITGTSEPLSE